MRNFLWTRIIVLACLFWAGAAVARSAEFTGHWTLDNLTAGIQNSGTNGATSDMTAVGGPTLTSGIIGGALSFNGTSDYLINQTAGNAAAVLTSYPISFSTWINKSTSDVANTHNTAVGFTQAAMNGVTYGAGLYAATEGGEVITRNNGTGSFDYAGGGLIDGLWHNVVGVINSTTSVQIFLDGKLVGGDTQAVVLNTNVDTLSIGGLIRSTSDFVARFGGDIDDPGLYDSNLTASEVVLINGLGRIGGIGLDQFDEAQTLLGGSVGSQAMIGGRSWLRVDNLTGVTGDFGGTLAASDAFIVTDEFGGGLAVIAPVPEPSSFLLLGLGMLGLKRRKRKAGK